jgi:hypothetical protein
MSSKRETLRSALLATAPGSDREAFLLANSGLPGPRGNLELMDACGDVLGRDEALALARLGPEEASTADGREFLPCCGIVALGRLVAEGDDSLVPGLRAASSDPRWRVRESVAIALQRWGDTSVAAMHAEVAAWTGSLYEARAAVAAVCEPRLLRSGEAVAGAAAVLDTATRLLAATPRPRGEPGRVLSAALGYGWSVAIAGSPSIALPPFETWATSDDPDIRRLVRENLTKARFAGAAPDAVARLRSATG